MGRGFLGNRIAGLKARVTLLSLDPAGPPLPALNSIKLGEQQAYLRFAVSAKFGRVYAAVDDSIVIADAASSFALRKHAPFGERKGTMSGAVAIDAQRGRLYVVGMYRGRENTSVWKLDERGQLAVSEPTWLADGIPVEKPEIRGMLSAVRTSNERRCAGRSLGRSATSSNRCGRRNCRSSGTSGR